MDVNESPRILITRLSHIGDCILTLPVLTSIKKKYPQAFVAWAVESPTNQLLELHPDLDELVLIPKGWMRKPKCWIELSKKLKSYRFDIAIDPQGITKSAALARISGAKKRIGISGKWGRELSPWLNSELVETQSPHIVERSVELLRSIGIDLGTNVQHEYGLPVCRQSLARVESGLMQDNVGDRFVAINPGGSWKSKRWEMDRFGSVASHLKRQHGLTSVVVWAGNEELAMAKTISEMDPLAAVIAPQTNLRELAALASRASFLIGGDTGPLHIASAMGTPCIGLYGTTQPMNSGAYGPNHLVVQKWYQSGSCRERRSAENDAMRDITVSDVISACDQMIESLKPGNRSVA